MSVSGRTQEQDTTMPCAAQARTGSGGFGDIGDIGVRLAYSVNFWNILTLCFLLVYS